MTLNLSVGNTMKEIFLAIAMLVSSNHDGVRQDIEHFFNKPDQYFDQHREDLEHHRLITEVDVLIENPIIVLHDALDRFGFLLVMDWKDDFELYLESGDLETLSNSKLANLKCLTELKGADPEIYHTAFRLTQNQKDIDQHAILNCISNAGYSLLSIDEGGDGYGVMLIDKTQKGELLSLFKQAKFKYISFDPKH